MLTRRSRRENGSSPNDSASSPKAKKRTPGRKSIDRKCKTPRGKSIDRKDRTRTPHRRSSDRKNRTRTPHRQSSDRKNRLKTPQRKSTDEKIRPRSRSWSQKIINIPRVVLERFDAVNSVDKPKNETKRGNSLYVFEPVYSTITTPTINNLSTQGRPPLQKQNSSNLIYNDGSDYENEPTNNRSVISKQTEFGGSFGNLILAILLPLVVILDKIAIKAKGNLIPFPRGYLRFANYYDRDVFLWTGAIVGLQLLVSLVPLAKKHKGLHDGSSINYYRFSGFMNFIIGVLIVTAMDYYKCPINFILEMVTKKTVPHIAASVICTLILSLVLYLKAKISKQVKLNFSNCIQTFFIGTTINPTLGPINVKLALFRYSMLMTILINFLAIMDSVKNSTNINLYVIAGLQIFYSIDKLVFEYNLLPSFYLQKEKDGYWTIIQQFLQPIINFIPIQILHSKNGPVNYIILSISSIVFLLGYICQRYSDIIKYRFVTNSKYGLRFFSRRYAIESVGLWSYVRYPNYIGTIIVHLALVLPVIEPDLNNLQSSWPLFLYPLYYIVTLSHRCVRNTTYSQLQNDYAWGHFNSVKWNLIPKIF